MISSRFGLSRTSEKTLEINVLNEFAAFTRFRYRRLVTLIAPTQPEEDRLGFDEIVEGLPPGRIVAIRFKRPYETKRGNFVRFSVDTAQLNKLAGRFGRHQAYLFLTPLPRNHQVIARRRRLLNWTLGIDIYDIPRLTKTSQKTRTVRVRVGGSPPSAGDVEIADPRRYESINNVANAAHLVDSIAEGESGIDVKEITVSSSNLPRQKPGIGVHKLYFIHVSSETYR